MAEQTDVLTLLAQLEAERAELDVTIAHLRRRMGMSPANGENIGGAGVPTGPGRDTTITGRVRPDEFFRLSQRDAIVKFLSIMKQPQSPVAIVNGLRAGGVLTQAKNFYANVNTELKRMKARNIVVNTSSGWGLAEWYPQRTKQSDAVQSAGKVAKRSTKSKIRHSRTARRRSASSAGSNDGMKWHEFLGAAAKAGKTMEQAAAEWKQRKAAIQQ